MNYQSITLSGAYEQCMQMVRNHYENFPVGSVLIPSGLRKHVAAIYAFARTADDFADEQQDRSKLLDWRKQLHDCIKVTPQNPVFLALSDTIRKYKIPVQWLDDLLTAFLLDLDQKRFKSLKNLEDYCRYSANPVGRLILWLFDYRTEKIMAYADYITTALQLTNFWQDISVDLKRDKIYIPTNFLERYQISETEILKQQGSDKFTRLMEDLIDRTKIYFRKGLPLLGMVQGRLKMELQFTIAGGYQTLLKAKSHKARLLTFRPALNKLDWIVISTAILLN